MPNNFGAGRAFHRQPVVHHRGRRIRHRFFDKRSKFVHYLPEIVIINNLEFDHADIFENLAAIQTSFRRLIALIPRNGQLLANGDDANLAPLLQRDALPGQALWPARGATASTPSISRYGPTAAEFEIPSFKFHLNLMGEFNVRNALAVIAAAKHCGLSNKQIQSGLRHLQGRARAAWKCAASPAASR